MKTPVEAQFRDAVARSVAGLAPPTFQVDDLVRLGQSARRRRRIAATVAVAAAVTVIVAITISSLKPGLLSQRQEPAVTPVPTGAAVLTPSPNNPAPTATADPTVPTSAGGIEYLLRGNTILTGNGRRVTIPAPAGFNAVQAVRVSGGWVVSLTRGGVTAQADIRFLSAAGELRSFQPALSGAPHGFAADGSRLAARIGHDIYVYDLPSLTVRHRIEDVRRTVGDGQVDRIWLRGDWLVVNFQVLGDSGPGFSGVVVWNLSTGASAALPDLYLDDVSADGTLAVLGVWVGPVASERARCVSVVPFNDQMSAPEKNLCHPGVSLTSAHFSPDGAWLAIHADLQPTEVWLYRTDQVQAGTAEPVRHDDVYPGGHVIFEDWQDASHVIVAEDRMLVVARCPVADRPCEQIIPPRGEEVLDVIPDSR